MAKVTVIPPVERQTAALRVAAYCRVSSDSADQLHSYATQVKSYTKLIEEHAGWELVDIYADEGRTGTKLDKRDEFNRMMRDCRKGKIDKVLVKSVSRFARNTRDCLVSLRELSQLGVAVQFEEDHIDTETLTTELMVSVSGSLAQEESVSISKNQRMSYQRRMERGEFSTCFAPYGYQLTDGKHLEIYEPQAQWVRWMFDQYLCGQSANEIAVRLQKQNVPQANGKCNWGPRAVTYILTNEKYIGDKVKRLLENPRYTGRDGYPVLVGENVFQAVQEKIQAKADSYVHKNVNPINRLKPMLRCSVCNGRLLGASGQRKEEGVLRLKCERCGAAVAIGQRELMREVVRGWENRENKESETYVPSKEVVRLTNLVNRQLEQPEDPEQVIALIMKAAAARYDCCTIALQDSKRNRLTEVDWKHFGQAVSYITISAENDVTLYFQ